MEQTLLEQRDGLRRGGIRLTAIGELDRLPRRLRSLLQEIEHDTSGATAVTPQGPTHARRRDTSREVDAGPAPWGRRRGARTGGEGNRGAVVDGKPLPPTMTLCLAVSYGGRAEVATAARELAAEVAAGSLDPADIDEEALARRLSTARLGIPDPDLVVRTSGESRLSNLLLWQAAYSELYVVGKAWPEFRRPDLVEAFR